MNKFLDLKYNLLAEKFFTVLSNFYYNSYLNVNKNFINTFINSFLDIFVKDEFIVSPSYQEKFVFFSPIISNLAAISDIKNTDNYLNKLKLSQNNLYKILTLLSARNSVEFNINTFFDINPYLASLWYTHYFLVSPFITQVMYKNILNHIKNLDYRFIPILPNFNFPYAVSSYYDIENDRNIKLKINQELYNQLKYIKINNNPNKNKIAIISARWYPYSAIYRSYYDFIKELSLHYELI